MTIINTANELCSDYDVLVIDILQRIKVTSPRAISVSIYAAIDILQWIEQFFAAKSKINLPPLTSSLPGPPSRRHDSNDRYAKGS
jgi:hypothetical protein